MTTSWRLLRLLVAVCPAAGIGLCAGAVPPPAGDLQLAPRGEGFAAANAHFGAARLLEESGREREALGHYLSFLESGGASDDLVAHIADMMLAYRGMEPALQLLDAQIREHPDSPQPCVQLIRFALKHADEHEVLLGRANVAAEEMLRKFPHDAGSYESAARLQLAQSRRDGAAKVMEQAARQDVKHPGFWLRAGRAAQEVWPIADAEKRAAHVQKINPFFEKARDLALAARDEKSAVQSADYFLFSNQLPAAADICERLVQRGAGLEARSRLVRLYEAMEKPAEALSALEALVKSFPSDVEHRRLLAGRYLQKRDIAKATEQLEAALQAGGGELQDYLQLCNLLRAGREPEKFLRFTQRATQLFPREPRVTYFGALARSRMKQYAEAAKFFDQSAKQAATKAPELLDDMFHFNHGVALERSGRFEDAAKQFEKSIQLTPADDPARAAGTLNYLGYMWLERGEHLDQSEQFIRKANDLEPGNAAYVDSLGWMLFKQGKITEALKELERAESLMKEITAEDAEILDHIAQTHDRLNQRSKAEEYWKRVIDLKPEDKKLMDRACKELGIGQPKLPPKDDPPAKKVK